MIPLLLAAGGLLSAGGKIMEGNAAYQDGVNQRLALEFQAKQHDQNAIQAVATGQRAAKEVSRETELLKSRMLAVAAASGAGASDPGLMNLIAEQAGIGTLNSMAELYKGEEQARQQRMTGKAKRYEGYQAEVQGRKKRDASRVSAAASLLSAGGNYFGG